MKKLLATLMAVGLLSAGAGLATAAPKADENGNRPNDHGLCTAFFNGQKNGHDKQKNRTGEYPGPFETLIDNAPDGSDGDSAGGSVADLWDWCSAVPGGIGGQPSHGRYTCTAVDHDNNPDTPAQTQCSENPAPNAA